MKQKDEKSQSENFNITSSETTIYENGNFIQISVKDLLNNEVALRQLINNLNLAQRLKEDSDKEVNKLKIEKSTLMLNPEISIIISIVNICSVILVGFGVNMLSSNSPPSASGWILTIGIILSILSSIAHPLLPRIIKNRMEKNNANKK